MWYLGKAFLKWEEAEGARQEEARVGDRNKDTRPSGRRLCGPVALCKLWPVALAIEPVQ